MMQLLTEDLPEYDPGCWLEQWITLEGPVIHAKYRMTYDEATFDGAPFGAPANRSPNEPENLVGFYSQGHEAPAIYWKQELNTLHWYGGEDPWTGDAVSSGTAGTLPPLSWGEYYPNTPNIFSGVKVTENWVAAVDSGGSGAGVYCPESEHYGIMPFNNANGTYTTPIVISKIDAGQVVETHAYFAVGTVSDIRAAFADITPVATIPTNVIVETFYLTTLKYLRFRGVPKAQAYRVYKDGVSWPNSSTEFHTGLVRLGDYFSGDVTVAAVIDGVEGTASAAVTVNSPADTQAPTTTNNTIAGSYPDGTLITLAEALPWDESQPVTILYAWGDSNPLTEYTEPITIQSGTLYWRGVDAENNAEAVQSRSYSIGVSLKTRTGNPVTLKTRSGATVTLRPRGQ
jgi:hypothetical protein